MLAGKRIYVVDDDVGFLKGIERLLRAHGFLVRTFASAEAFEAESDPIEAECLIVDIHLSGITGIELMRRLLVAGSSTPVIIVTGNGSDATRIAATAAGCSAYLEKPFSSKVLLDAIGVAVTAPRQP